MSKKKTQEFIVQVTRNENVLEMNEKTIEIAVKTWLKEHMSYTSNDITVTIFERK